jgi:hypothetical protein
MRIGQILALPLLGAAVAGSLVITFGGGATTGPLGINGDTPKNAVQHTTVRAFDVEFYVEHADAPDFAPGNSNQPDPDKQDLSTSAFAKDALEANSEKIARLRTGGVSTFAGDGYVSEGVAPALVLTEAWQVELVG